MQVTINNRCFTQFNAWLMQPYSPDLTNAAKIKANLSHIGNISRTEWAESFDIICDTLNLYDLTLVFEISVENLRLNKGSLILDLSLTMLNPDDAPLYVSFPLDRTLNIMKQLNNNIYPDPKTAAVIEETEVIKPEYNTNYKTPIQSPLSKKCSLPFFPEINNDKPVKFFKNENCAESITILESPRLVFA